MKKNIIYVITFLIIVNVLIFIKPLEKLGIDSFSFISDLNINFRNNVNEVSTNNLSSEELEAENNLLVVENEKLKKENELILNQNKELRNTLNVEQYKEKEPLIADVKLKKIDNFLNILVIDKGSKDGVKKNQLVNYQGKLIGIISEVNEEMSEVTLLSNSNIKFNVPVSIYTDNKKISSVLSEYKSNKNQLVIKPLYSSDTIKKGDNVYTNGYGENQEEGYLVGTIETTNASQEEYYIDFPKGVFDYVEVVI